MWKIMLNDINEELTSSFDKNDIDKDLNNNPIIEDDPIYDNLKIIFDYDDSIESIIWTCEHNIEHTIYNKYDKLVVSLDNCHVKIKKFIKELELLISRRDELVNNYNSKIVRVLKVVDEQ